MHLHACIIAHPPSTISNRKIASALASNASNNEDEDFIDLTFPKMKRLFFDFTTDEYGGGLANEVKVPSRVSKNASKDSLAGSIGSSSNIGTSASDKCDARSIEGSERDDGKDDNCEGFDGEEGNPREREKTNVAICGHFRGVVMKCKDEATLSSQVYTSTRNGLRRTACKTEVVPQLTVVDYGPKTSRVGSDYQVGAVSCGVL